MRPTSSNEIRRAFLEFFGELNHEIVPSSPLPQRDNPTLLFTNAGMNQFADIFLGKVKRPYPRAVTSQKCMRVQGKHNDLENVGPSPRHHTFFEMLGNFSFGDYFKKEAIDYAWTFLTQVMQLPPERLWATVYLDDDEAFELWQAHLPPERILRFGKEDNYWEMGEVGPCGPCSEVHYYLGPMDAMTADGVNIDDDYLEIWNLVFMQFDRDAGGQLSSLPRPSIDTGMGLERLARIVQAADSNYDTDLFTPAMDRVQELLGDTDELRAEKYVGYRVIADHGRAATFLIADGVRPGNTGEGYVLRMIIRRAARFGRKIGFTRPFLAEVAQVYINQMGEAYPELQTRRDHILHALTQEEERFARTLDAALDQLTGVLQQLKQGGSSEISGETAFNLYATHGLPLEITRDVAQEWGISVDETGYDAARAAHAAASGAGAFGQYESGSSAYTDVLAELVQSGRLDSSGVDYDPYTGPEMEAEIVALLKEGRRVESAEAGEIVELVTAATPFYVEAGGEVSDTGRILVAEGSGELRVDEMRRPVPGLIVHMGEVLRGELRAGQSAQLVVDDQRRRDIRRNHTATHILHRELRAHLGTHVTQAGSLVAPDRLRFDFAHDAAVDRRTLRTIETAINQAILANYPVVAQFMSQEEAISAGAMALFGEKYGEIVRTIQIKDDGNRYSFELCGGLHVSETAEIGMFRFVSEGAVAAGVRRVEAVTGRGAYELAAERLDTLERVAQKLNAPVADVEARLEALIVEQRAQNKKLERIQRELARGQFEALLAQAREIAGVTVVAAQVEVADVNGLREMADWFRDRVESGAAVFATVKDGKPLLVATVTEDLIKRGLRAGDLVREAAKMVGGGGGGRPNIAQAGGRDSSKLPEALAAVPGQVEQTLS